MSENLYFIPVIARALSEKNTAVAMEKAFEEIENKGQQERYAEGLKNFEGFMQIVYLHHNPAVGDVVRRRIAELATGAFVAGEPERKMVWRIIKSCPDWLAEYFMFCGENPMRDFLQELDLTIQILSNERPVGELHFDRAPSRKSVGAIEPGDYVLKLLNTGWIIWRGELTDRELIWADAFPGEDLRFAAGDQRGKQTGSKDLLNNGDVILHTYAGSETGSIEIELVR